MPSSAIPGAVANFITIMTAALPAACQIWYGHELGSFVMPQTLQITGVTGDQQPAEMGPNYKREETFAIDCSLVSFAGDQTTAAYLARTTEVMGLFATICVTIGNNPWLSSSGLQDGTAAVRYAEVGTFVLIPKPSDNGGSTAELTFAVHCSQRVTSLT